MHLAFNGISLGKSYLTVGDSGLRGCILERSFLMLVNSLLKGLGGFET